jgi:hypothetical protein
MPDASDFPENPRLKIFPSILTFGQGGVFLSDNKVAPQAK